MAILSDFDGGRSLHDTQHFALGQEVYDSQGNRWGYVQIHEASGGAHRLLRSTKHNDIFSGDSGGDGDVNATIAVGSDRLTVADLANRDFTPSTAGPLVGALGVITAGNIPRALYPLPRWTGGEDGKTGKGGFHNSSFIWFVSLFVHCIRR